LKNQIACADMIVVNRADLLADGEADKLRAAIRKPAKVFGVVTATMGARCRLIFAWSGCRR
jgi:cobalamin biosynthesis protein CobW